MSRCFFASDLHGRVPRYESLFRLIGAERPQAVFLGGDLLPSRLSALTPGGGACDDFVNDFLVPGFARLRDELGREFPRVFLIPGNDDMRSHEPDLIAAAEGGVWEYLHGRRAAFAGGEVYGYACVPPTPFLLKDWERYDVSRYVPPGSVSPEEGQRSVPVEAHRIRYATIRDDLAELVGGRPVHDAIFLFHAPPYSTALDRAALDGRMIDYAPLDVHVGSVAIQRFIETCQPRVTLHGHIHESARLTGAWSQRIGRTMCLSAAHDGPELALVRFDPQKPEAATRTLTG